MDERLEKALDFGNYSVTLNNQKRLLKEKFYDDCIMYQNGGRFTLSREFLSYLNGINKRTTVIIDDNDIPVEIKDLEEFCDDASNQYADAANQYFKAYKEMIANRKPGALVGYV